MYVCDLCSGSEFLKYYDLRGKIKRSIFIFKIMILVYSLNKNNYNRGFCDS